MTWSKERINEVYGKVKELALTDSAFRGCLLENPKGAIESFIGEKIPNNYSLQIIESDPSYAATFILPPLLANEITDDVLSAVAGGRSDSTDGCNKFTRTCSESSFAELEREDVTRPIWPKK